MKIIYASTKSDCAARNEQFCLSEEEQQSLVKITFEILL